MPQYAPSNDSTGRLMASVAPLGPAAEAIANADAHANDAGLSTYTELRDRLAEAERLLESAASRDYLSNDFRACITQFLNGER